MVLVSLSFAIWLLSKALSLMILRDGESSGALTMSSIFVCLTECFAGLYPVSNMRSMFFSFSTLANFEFFLREAYDLLEGELLGVLPRVF